MIVISEAVSFQTKHLNLRQVEGLFAELVQLTTLVLAGVYLINQPPNV